MLVIVKSNAPKNTMLLALPDIAEKPKIQRKKVFKIFKVLKVLAEKFFDLGQKRPISAPIKFWISWSVIE